MPNIASAKKRMRQSKKQSLRGDVHEMNIKQVIKKAKGSSISAKKRTSFFSEAYSVIDKAYRERVIHKNKAGRLKRRITKLVQAKK